MKKSLIALAAIAAVGAASAQVTVYGKLDVGVSNTSAGGTVVSLSNFETSRFGVKAEDKMGGMTASVVLEGKIYGDNSVFKGFDRVATVGLAGSFGAVTIGNQWTPYDNAMWTADPLEYSNVTALASGMYNYDVGNTGMGNAKNSIQFATPDMGGFQGFLLVANSVTGNAQGATNYTGFGLNYAKGPLVINFANQAYDGKFQADSPAGVTPVVKAAQLATASVKSNVLALQYNVGAANLYAAMANTDNGAGSSDSGYSFGVKVPMGKNYAAVGFSANKNSKGGVDTTTNAWAAQFIQTVTKSTKAYYGIQSVSSSNLFTAGLQYSF